MTPPARQPTHHQPSFQLSRHRPQEPGGSFAVARRARNVLRRVPVWTWRVLMHSVKASENSLFNVDPITGVEYFHDIDFVGAFHPPEFRARHRRTDAARAGSGSGAGGGGVAEARRCRRTRPLAAGAAPDEPRLDRALRTRLAPVVAFPKTAAPPPPERGLLLELDTESGPRQRPGRDLHAQGGPATTVTSGGIW